MTNVVCLINSQAQNIWKKAYFLLGEAIAALGGLQLLKQSLQTPMHPATYTEKSPRYTEFEVSPCDVCAMTPLAELMMEAEHAHVTAHKHHTRREPRCPAAEPIRCDPSRRRLPRLALSLARCSAAGLEDLTQCVELLLKNNQSRPTPISCCCCCFYFPPSSVCTSTASRDLSTAGLLPFGFTCL